MLFTVANSHAQTINLDGTDELYSRVRYSSVTGDVTAIEKTRNLRDGWDLLSAMTEDPLNPGVFLFPDPEALYFGMNHHRAVSAADPAMLNWMATYPVSYIDFEETDLLPLFEWTPYPTAPDSYPLDVYPTIDNREGAFVPLPEPLLTITHISAGSPVYSFDGLYPELLPHRICACSVGARLRDRLIRGRTILIEGFEPSKGYVEGRWWGRFPN